jgi:hypothetical protein
VSKESRRAARAGRTPNAIPASRGPSGAARAGRRERVRRLEQRSFFERYRTLIIGGVAVAIAAVVVGVILVGATKGAYSCTTEWMPTPTASPGPGASPRLGYAQPDMGRFHIAPGTTQKYTFCPPASGNHYNQPGVLGPIIPRVYRPEDNVGPPNWLHNLEHGGLVVLYRGDSPGATADGLAKFKAFFDAFPPGPICKIPGGQISPVIARFDQMKWPYAALVWGRVLPLDTWDPVLVLKLYATESERLDANGAFVTPPEPQCAAPSTSPSPGTSASPSPSASASGGSASPSPSASPNPS